MLKTLNKWMGLRLMLAIVALTSAISVQSAFAVQKANDAELSRQLGNALYNTGACTPNTGPGCIPNPALYECATIQNMPSCGVAGCGTTSATPGVADVYCDTVTYPDVCSGAALPSSVGNTCQRGRNIAVPPAPPNTTVNTVVRNVYVTKLGVVRGAFPATGCVKDNCVNVAKGTP